ncbi:MAG: carbonic anhydrase [Alphaproteobacteria bacterium]|nr:carbonic anhydrase [Alphaproteobacteria bacterium]
MTRRRRFLTGAGAALFAGGCGCAIGLPFKLAHAGESCAAQTAESQAAMTPAKALQDLKDGNARFVDGKMRNCNYMDQVKSTGTGQFPFAAIVGCIDSRESTTTTFDQGIGDVFRARVAGNFVNDDILGSLEFACAAAGAKLVLVCGHTECGAIKGACDDVVLGNLTQTLANIKPAVAAVPGFDDDRTSGNAAFVQAVADKNVELTVARIRERSRVLRDMEKSGDIMIAGAMYDVHNGRVAFAWP